MTVDANMNCPGVPLTDIDIEFGSICWDAVARQSLSTIQFKLIVRSDLAPGRVDMFWIMAPEGIMFTDPGEVQTLGLPVKNPKPYRIEGIRLTIALLPNSIIQEGEIKILFAVKNPSTIPNDNVWTITGLAGDQREFLELVPSYVFGQQCTEDTVGGIGGAAGGASRKFSNTIFNSIISLSFSLPAVLSVGGVAMGMWLVMSEEAVE